MEIRLDGKSAIVTGGSRGIGKGIAAAYAAAGANVMITSRKADICEEAAAEIGHGAAWIAGNAGDPADADRVIAGTLERFGAIDILVNNAATNPYAGPTIEIDLPRWEKTVQVNLTAPLVWAQKCWEAWMKDNGGVIVNITSVGGLSTNPMLGPYNITKAALIHLTKQLAAELGPGVRVNAIAPSVVKTDFARLLWEDGRGEEVAATMPLRRLGEPEDVAGAALYLAAETGRWITGETMVLDGGGLVAYGAT